MDREALLVELVDGDGTGIGAETVARAHTAPGQLHRAFSVLLYDPAGRTLLQRRAAEKTRFPRRWSNTCCGHPGPGEDLLGAADRRLAAELGITASLQEMGSFTYWADDPYSGRVEHEWDHVLVGVVGDDQSPDPDPAEVDEWAWVDPGQLAAAMHTEPRQYTPWLPEVLRIGLQPGGPARG